MLAFPRARHTLVAALLSVAALVAASASSAEASVPTVKVMTRNVYLGADLIPLATTPPGSAFDQAVNKVIDGLKAEDANGRMKLIAAEIAKAKPHLVGLQEITTWRNGPQPPRNVLYDYLKDIRKELSRLGAKYKLVTSKQGFNVTAPLSDGTGVRVSIGDATLVKSGVKVSNAKSGQFKSQFSINTQVIGPVKPNRTWNQLDATVDGAKFHFVNTHLEAYDASVRLKQAQELVKGPLKSKLATILVGDLNSGPDLSKPEDRPPFQAIAKAGFKAKRTKAFSCCFDDLKLNKGWDHNVDWIMTKPGLPLIKSSITGKEKTKGGVHPSDHGGVISELGLEE